MPLLTGIQAVTVTLGVAGALCALGAPASLPFPSAAERAGALRRSTPAAPSHGHRRVVGVRCSRRGRPPPLVLSRTWDARPRGGAVRATRDGGMRRHDISRRPPPRPRRPA